MDRTRAKRHAGPTAQARADIGRKVEVTEPGRCESGVMAGGDLTAPRFAIAATEERLLRAV